MKRDTTLMRVLRVVDPSTGYLGPSDVDTKWWFGFWCKMDGLRTNERAM